MFEANKIGDAMVMEFQRATASGYEYTQRFSFVDITERSYRWTNEVVNPDGSAVTIGTLSCARRGG